MVASCLRQCTVCWIIFQSQHIQEHGALKFLIGDWCVVSMVTLPVSDLKRGCVSTG